MKDLRSTIATYFTNMREYITGWIPQKRPLDWRLYLVSVGAVLVLVGVAFTLNIPDAFPERSVISVEEGMSLSEVANELKEKKVIHSPAVFQAAVALSGGSSSVIAGDYYFEKRRTTFTIADRITDGEYGLTPVSVTIPEGSNVFQIADILDNSFESEKFNKEEFIKKAAPLEGYLFPDTYFLRPNIEEKEIIEIMRENFSEKISTVRDQIDEFDKPLSDVIIMASMIEREAHTTKARRMIAGILWKRLEKDMPLQVDAVFPYINGKNTFELTYDDLAIDSPYNTYRYDGLPVGPIANPGLGAIKATVNPIESDYVYYLSDREGNMHYAETLEEHQENKRRYLK